MNIRQIVEAKQEEEFLKTGRFEVDIPMTRRGVLDLLTQLREDRVFYSITGPKSLKFNDISVIWV